MSLTLGSGPLAGHPGGSFNFEIDAPAHRLYFDELPKRMRAVVDGHTLVDSTRGRLLFETGILGVPYFPLEDFDRDLLEATDHTTHCPFKGDASYFSIRTGDGEGENAVWHYPSPLPAAAWLDGYAAIYHEAPDTWLEEDEELPSRLRDPYHRVDVLQSSRHVRVTAGGETIAESDAPKLVFETSLPPRAYLPAEDVRTELLEPTDTTTFCPYKGTATYWSVKAPGGPIEDGAWTYVEPLPEALPAAGHVCFLGEGIEVQIAG